MASRSSLLPAIRPAFAALILIGTALAAPAPAQRPGDAVHREPYPIPLAPRVPEDKELVTLASGASYSVLTPDPAPNASNRPPTGGDFFRAHYTVWYSDGRLYDSSVLRNTPLKSWVGKSFTGWNDVLQLMPVGGHWKVALPAESCRGAAGALPEVPANEALIFEIQLLEVIRVPTFHAERPAESKTTPGGIKYEVLQAGEGSEPPDKNRVLSLDYGLWNTSGTLLDSSARQGALFEIKRAQMEVFWDLKFMKEAFELLRPGARLRFEVPPDQCYGAANIPGLPGGSTTIWEFELVRVAQPHSTPAFGEPDPAKSTVTETGLRVELVREGTGRRPVATGKVTAHYALWLTTGRLFDASYESGQPTRLDLADPGLLPGIREALLLMSEGGALRCRLLPMHAYGGQGWSPYIGPNADLLLYLELISAG